MALIAREMAESVDVSIAGFNHRLNFVVNPGCLERTSLMGEHSAIMLTDLSILGARIKERLKDLGKTQGDLAEALELSDNAVSKWVKSGKISRENAVRAAEFLRTTVDWLTGKEDRLPAKAIHVALDWNTLDEPLRSQLAEMIHQQADAVRARERPAEKPTPPLLSRAPKRAKVTQ